MFIIINHGIMSGGSLTYNILIFPFRMVGTIKFCERERISGRCRSEMYGLTSALVKIIFCVSFGFLPTCFSAVSQARLKRACYESKYLASVHSLAYRNTLSNAFKSNEI